MVARLLGGRFWLAPIDENEIQNALDIGTGTGIRTWYSHRCVMLLTLGSRRRDCRRPPWRTGTAIYAASDNITLGLNAQTSS